MQFNGIILREANFPHLIIYSLDIFAYDGIMQVLCYVETPFSKQITKNADTSLTSQPLCVCVRYKPDKNFCGIIYFFLLNLPHSSICLEIRKKKR